MQAPRELPHLGPLQVPEDSPARALTKRLGLALALLLAVTIMLWLDRDGLRDNAHPGEPISLADVFYFTVVSLATVGYGDIAPVSDGARLINSVLLTPVRIFVWVLFLGTAYELTVARMRLREECQCGNCANGSTTTSSSAAMGSRGGRSSTRCSPTASRATISSSSTRWTSVAAATEAGLVALHGDASSSACSEPPRSSRLPT